MGSNTGETGETSLVPTERSLELRVGEQAIKQLKTDLELTHPELTSLFFVPQDFTVFYGLQTTLEEINATITERKYEPFLIKKLVQYLKKSAKPSQRNWISAKLHREDKQHLYVDKTKLTDRALENLSEQAYKDVFSKQLKRVNEIKKACGIERYFEEPVYSINIDFVQEKLEGLIKEASSFIRNFSIVTVNESTERTAWESIIPVDEMTKVLGGLLYESKRVKPFKASGKIFSRSHSENAMPQYTLLEPSYGTVLSDKLFMLIEDFNGDLKQLVDRLTPFAKKGAELPPDLQINFALYNYFVKGLYSQNGNPLSSSYAVCITMALSGINKHLKEVFSFIHDFKLDDLNPGWGGHSYRARNIIEKKTGFELIYHDPKLGDSYHTARKPV